MILEHGPHPQAHARRRFVHTVDLIGLELGAINVLLNSLDGVLRDVVAIVRKHALQEAPAIAQQLALGSLPVVRLCLPQRVPLDCRLDVEHDARRLHGDLHTQRRPCHAANFLDVSSLEGVEALHGLVQQRQHGIQVPLCVIGNGACGLGLLPRQALLLCHHSASRIGLDAVLVNLHHHFVHLGLRLLELWPQANEGLPHLGHLLGRVLQLLQSHLQSLLLRVDILVAADELLVEDAQELQVLCGRHVVVPPHRLQVHLAGTLAGLVNGVEHLHQRLAQPLRHHIHAGQRAHIRRLV